MSSNLITMNQKVGLIIGGNRGIGRALVEALAREWGKDGIVYLTARTESDAQKTRQAVEQTTGLTLKAFVFDLSNPSDSHRVAEELRKRHGYVDVLFQNGAYLPRAGRDAADDARPMIQANSHGTLRVLEAFTPLIRENGRLVVVASALGVLEKLPRNLRPLFDSRKRSPQQINAAIDEYVRAVESGSAQGQGWPDWVNIPSKVAQVALTRSFAREARASGVLPAGATINAACPGVTLTDATRDFMGTVFNEADAQSPEVAAQGLMWFLSGKINSAQPHGELIQHGKIIEFGD